MRLSDLQEAIGSFIDALDPELIALQELAAVLACSDTRYLPEKYKSANRSELNATFAVLKSRVSG